MKLLLERNNLLLLRSSCVESNHSLIHCLPEHQTGAVRVSSPCWFKNKLASGKRISTI